MFIQRVYVYPAGGKEGELRSALEDWTKKRQAQGVVISLTVQIFGSEGTAFAITSKFRDLAEFENRRRQNQADPAFQTAIVKVASLSRAPSKFELYEILVPFQK